MGSALLQLETHLKASPPDTKEFRVSDDGRAILPSVVQRHPSVIQNSRIDSVSKLFLAVQSLG